MKLKSLILLIKLVGKSTIVPVKRNDILVMLITKSGPDQSAQEKKYETISAINAYDGTLHVEAYLENDETDCIIEHPEEIQLQTNL